MILYAKSFSFFGPWPNRALELAFIYSNLGLFIAFQTCGLYFYSLTYSNDRVRNLDEILVTPEKLNLLSNLMKNHRNSLLLSLGTGVMSFPVLLFDKVDDQIPLVTHPLFRVYGYSIFFIWVNTLLLILISRKDIFGRYMKKALIISQVGIWLFIAPYLVGCYLPFVQILVIYVVYLYSVVDFNKAVK